MTRLDTPENGRKLMIETIGGRRTARILVESETFSDGSVIPDGNSD